MGPLVVVIGDAALDVRVTPSEPIRPGGDVPASIDMRPGGQGANVAVRLARRGARVRLVAAVADDPAGAAIRSALGHDGVALHPRPADRSSMVVVMAGSGGERTMLSQRAPLFASPFEPGLISDADWLVVSGYALLEPAGGLSMTGPASRRVVLGCSLGSGTVRPWIARASALAPHLVVLNADEAGAIAPGATDQAGLARTVANRFDAIAIVTRATGSTAAIGAEVIETASLPVGPVVDTTGAGDAFAAALIGDLVDTDWPPQPARLERAMLAGHSLAAAVAGIIGAQALVHVEEAK